MTNSIDEICRGRMHLRDRLQYHREPSGYRPRGEEGGAEERCTKLIVADPRRIELVDYADLWLQHRPGTDVALINGMLNAIISNGWTDKTFVEERTEGFEALADSVKEYTPEAVEEITGVKAADIVEAARLYAQSDELVDSLFHGYHPAHVGNEQRPRPCQPCHGGRTDRKAVIRASIRCAVRTTSRVRATWAAFPTSITGYQRVDDDAVRNKFEKAWGVTLAREARSDAYGDDEGHRRGQDQGPLRARARTRSSRIPTPRR